jgi:hypothetical protein
MPRDPSTASAGWSYHRAVLVRNCPTALPAINARGSRRRWPHRHPDHLRGASIYCGIGMCSFEALLTLRPQKDQNGSKSDVKTLTRIQGVRTKRSMVSLAQLPIPNLLRHYARTWLTDGLRDFRSVAPRFSCRARLEIPASSTESRQRPHSACAARSRCRPLHRATNPQPC